MKQFLIGKLLWNTNNYLRQGKLENFLTDEEEPLSYRQVAMQLNPENILDGACKDEILRKMGRKKTTLILKIIGHLEVV